MGGGRRPLGERDRASAPAAVSGELLELVGSHVDVERRTVAAGVDDREQLCGHDREIVVLLVAVGPRAQIDLRDRAEPVPRAGVDEAGDLDAVTGGDRE